MTHRILILASSFAGALLAWILPHIVLAIHAAHGMSTVHELETYRLIDTDRLDELRTEIGNPNYSVAERIRSVGATKIYLPIVSYVLIGVFGLIGFLAWRSSPEHLAVDRPHDSG